MRLTHRYVLAFCLVVLVSGGVLAVTFDAHRTDVAESAETSVEDRAELSAAMLDDRIREQQRSVSLGATNPVLADHGTEAQQRMLETFVERSAFDGASVVDEDGVIQWIASETEADHDVVGSDISDRSYVRHALDGEEYVTDPFRAQTGNDIVVISAPIRNEDGEVVGALSGAYHLDETELFDPLGSADEREGTTVEANGQILFSDADRFDETISASVALETTNWTVTAHRDQAAVSTAITRLAVGQVLSGLVLLGSVTVFGIWIYRSKISRIGRLLERVRALERREYDGGPPIGGTAEWQRIDDALTRLGATLARREQMLLVLNRILRHNLRNSLNIVSGRATELEAALDGEERDSATEIRRVTEDLLELAERARTTEDLLDPVATDDPRTDVAAVVRERVAAFEDAADTQVSGTRTEISVTGTDRAVAACGEEIAVAIDELLANTVDHAGPDPTVAVAVAVDKTTDRVLVRIDDDGPGIPDEEVSVLTGDRAISQINHTGGIGLWLVDWLVGRYDGRLLIPRSGGDDVDGDGVAAHAGGDSVTDLDVDGVFESVDSPIEDERVDRGATIVVTLPCASDDTGDSGSSRL